MGPKSCSRPSTTQPCTSASKLFSACTPLAEPPVLLSTLVMVSPTTSQSMKVMPFPTPLPVWTWPVEILLTTTRRSLLKEDTPSSPPLNVKSSEMSRKSFATSPWTSNPRWPPPPPPPPSKRATNCQMDKSSPSETKDSVAQKPSSNHGGSLRKQRPFRRYHHVPRYCRQNAKGNHRSCPIHHEDQDHCSTREKILRLDRRFHPCFPLHLPIHVDHQGRLRWSWSIHRPQKMLLNSHTVPDLFSLQAALDIAFQPFNNLFSSSFFIFSLSHTLSYSKGSKSLSNAQRDRAKRCYVGGRCRKLVGKQLLCLLLN